MVGNYETSSDTHVEQKKRDTGGRPLPLPGESRLTGCLWGRPPGIFLPLSRPSL